MSEWKSDGCILCYRDTWLYLKFTWDTAQIEQEYLDTKVESCSCDRKVLAALVLLQPTSALSVPHWAMSWLPSKFFHANLPAYGGMLGGTMCKY